MNSITNAGPNAASNIDTDEEQAKFRKRPPHPHPHVQEIYTAELESGLDADDTDSEISFAVHSQDEGSLSTDDTTPRMFHILITPAQRTLNELLAGTSMVNTNNSDIAANTLQQPKQSTQVHLNLKPVMRAPLLPTPHAPARQHRNPTFPRPSQFQSNRFYQQHLPRPFYHRQPPLLPLPSRQIPALSGPYQHAQHI